MSAKRYNIALLVANITDPFSNAVTRGAVSAAARLDADLTVFPGKYVGIQDKYDLYDTTYEYQHNVLFGYAAQGGFDHIIAAVGTIAYALDNEGKKAFLDRLGDVPVLSLAADIEGYDSLEFDNSSVMYEIIDELVSQGRQNIGIMAGNLNNCECEERFTAFKDALGRHGIALDSSNVMFCDISEYCADEADLLIERVPGLDAVVCINDKVAAVMCERLKIHGRTVGRDVAVVGFDDLPGSAELDPPLATVRADAEGLGARAVEKVINRLNGIEDSQKYYPTSFIRRSSCSRDGCPKGEYEKLTENEREKLRQAAIDRIHIDNIFVRDTMMIGRNIQTSYVELLKRLSLIGSSTAFIYTPEQPFTHMPEGKLPGDLSWRFRSYCYGRSAYSPPEEEQRVSFKKVFSNKYLCTNRQHCFIASALFAADKQYGLALLEPASCEFFDELELVCYILSSGVRTISILSEHEQLLSKLRMANYALEKESKIDSLTGIYNRRGFYLAADKMMTANDKASEYMICYADMDDLKLINDGYGHVEGDESLKLVAECMRSVFGKKAVIGRLGGDEYAAILPASKKKPESYLAKKDRFVSEFNASQQKPYRFGLSMGILRCRCENGYDLKAALDKADDLLYIQKQKKKK